MKKILKNGKSNYFTFIFSHLKIKVLDANHIKRLLKNWKNKLKEKCSSHMETDSDGMVDFMKSEELLIDIFCNESLPNSEKVDIFFSNVKFFVKLISHYSINKEFNVNFSF